MRKYLFFLIGTVLLFGCQDVKKPVAPENLISKEKMTAILSDIYLTNAARSVNNKLLRKTRVRLDSLIYVRYDVDSLQFAESNTYYSADLKAYKEIISGVKTHLEVLKHNKDSIYEIIKNKKEDSILKANKDNPSFNKIKELPATKLLKAPIQN